jgi:hypothetical protein
MRKSFVPKDRTRVSRPFWYRASQPSESKFTQRRGRRYQISFSLDEHSGNALSVPFISFATPTSPSLELTAPGAAR